MTFLGLHKANLSVAGDTAQCISRDSCFRFQDLKSLFFQKYERLGILAGQTDLAKLDLFTLSKNYRTHNGILKLAAKVVDVLSTAFPYAIDKFTPELGDFDGPAPILFSGFSSEIFSPREAESTTTISEFGAEQVLIVRDEETKCLLSETMGENALILTILESKGMEFQDVFLFNFFSGSSCQTAFRALANSQTTGSRLDDTKYPELCIELKNFYVAITRSREMLYIIESDTSAAQPMQDMWGLDTKSQIIDVLLPDDPTLQTRLNEIKLGQSNPEEWMQKGNEFFNQRMYEQAMYCYRRAGKPKLANMCQAFIEEQSGRDIISDPNCRDAARAHYLEAARLFRLYEKNDKALKCYESIKEYLMAAELCLELSKMPGNAHEIYTLRAADFFMDADKIERAIPLYKQLGLHERVISAYRKVNNVKDLVDYLKCYRTDIDEKLFNRNARIIALTIFSSKNTSNDIKRPAITLLSVPEQAQLYRQFKFYEELQKLLISQGLLEEAIELSYSEGYWKDLRDLLKRAESNPNFDQELLTAKGEQFAERILFYELSTSLLTLVRKGNMTASAKGLAVQKLTSYPKISKIFHDAAEFLNEMLFNEIDGKSTEPSDVPPESLILADLLILQLFNSETEKIAPRIQATEGLMDGVITISTQRLLGLHRTRVLADVDILRVFFQVVKSEHSDGYTIIKSSPLYNGNSDGGQQITSDELLERILGVLREWIVKAFSWYANRREEEYMKASACRHFVFRGFCNRSDCRFGQHKRVIQGDEMMELLQMAWSMSLLTSHCNFVDRNGAFGGALPYETLRRHGHQWFKRVFDSIIVVSDLVQNPSASLFLARKRSNAISLRRNGDASIRRGGSMILGCLDDFAWRLRGVMRNMIQPDFWKMLDAWERIAALRVPSGYAALVIWEGYFPKIEPWGKSAMCTLHQMERCLLNPSQIKHAMWSFQEKFQANLRLFKLSGSNEVHVLLNRLDHVMAIIIYFSSCDDLVLKKSQIEFLHENGALRLNLANEYTKGAADLLDKMVGVYNLIWEIMEQTEMTAWYRDAMYRRIEESSILAILNSRTPFYMTGREIFIKGFLERARNYNFWAVRQGAFNREAAWSVPNRIDKFATWIIANIDVVQSQADPIVFSHLYEKPKGQNKFRGLPVATVLFQQAQPAEIPSQNEEIAEVQTADAGGNIDTEDLSDSSESEKSQINIKAAEIIQKNWRICSKFIRNKRYLEQNPIHRRITQILKSLDLPPESDHDMFRKCFRLAGFVLLESIQGMRSKLRAITARLDVACKKGSMNVMEKVLGWHELVHEYNEKITAIEMSIEPSLASSAGNESIVAKVLIIIRQTWWLQENISSSASGLDSWIHKCA